MGGSSRANKMIVNFFKNNKFRNLIYILNIGTTKESIFIISNAKKGFNYQRQAFIKVLIPQHFDLKNHIQIETNASNYVISRVLS